MATMYRVKMVDANVDMIINGGSSPYNIAFNSSLTLNVQNELDTNNIPLILAGSYYYTITDTNGCSFSDSIILTEPLPFIIYSTIK